MYAAVPTPSSPNAATPPRSARRHVTQRCIPAGAAACPVVRANARRRSINPVHSMIGSPRSEEHTSELQSRLHLVCRLLLEKKKKKKRSHQSHDAGTLH